MLPKKLTNKLADRRANNSLRTLGHANNLTDFSSNDYLGFSTSEEIFRRAAELLQEHKLEVNGATGSRLLSGNYDLYAETEGFVANFHATEAALIFNSGYDANLGFFSCVPQRGDVIIYDELCHASIRDGIGMSLAKAHKFKHNDLNDLKSLLKRSGEINETGDIYVVTEAVFSMDGDAPDLQGVVEVAKNHNAYLIIDEAHAVGLFGERGEGLVQELELQDEVFARLVTFGKAMGCHGGAILGSNDLKQYLVNFSRSLIYTTGLPPHSVATILAAYQQLTIQKKYKQKLHINIAILQLDIKLLGLSNSFIVSRSAIHSCIVPSNNEVKRVSALLKEAGIDVKPILSPTVPIGSERLRICIHSFNTEAEIKRLLELIATFVS